MKRMWETDNWIDKHHHREAENRCFQILGPAGARRQSQGAELKMFFQWIHDMLKNRMRQSIEHVQHTFLHHHLSTAQSQCSHISLLHIIIYILHSFTYIWHPYYSFFPSSCLSVSFFLSFFPPLPITISLHYIIYSLIHTSSSIKV